MTDRELICRYVDHRDAAALEALARRHYPWVRAMAERIVPESSQADDVAQAVLILLARKAASLRNEAKLSTWLFSVTRYCALNLRRSEQRRRRHEREAAAMRDTVLNADPAWSDIAPVLDEAVSRLSRADRQAVLLRFYQQKNFAEVGTAMDVSEEAARKRVNRALEKLRLKLARSGLQLSAPAMLAHLRTELAASAPAAATFPAASAAAGGLAKSVGAMLWWTTVKSCLAAAAAIAILIVSAAVWLQQPPPPATAAAQAPPPRASQPSSHTGRVVNAEGDPIANASVYLVTTGVDIRNAALLAETSSDAQGYFTLPQNQMQSPRTSLLVRAEGYGLTVGPPAGNRSVEIVMRPAATFSSRLLDPDGKPAAHLPVYVEMIIAQQQRVLEAYPFAYAAIPPRLRPQFSATTDDEGYVEFTSIGEGLGARLQMDDSRYARLGFRAQIRTQSVQVEPTIVQLVRGYPAAGTVLDRANKPLAGLKIRLSASRVDDSYAEVETDAEGKFQAQRMPAAQYSVSIMESVSTLYLSSLGTFTLDAQSPPARLTAEPAARVNGTLRRKPDGALAANTEIGVSRAGAEVPYHAWSGEDGTYAINVPQGHYAVYLMKPSVVSKPGDVPDVWRVSPAVEPVQIDLKLGETRSVDLLLPPDEVKALAGRVVDPQGNGVEDVEVFGFSPTAFANPDQIATTDASGAFAMPRAGPGWILYARRGKWSTLSSVKVGEAPGNVGIRIHPNATSALKVYVTDEQAKPISGASVTLMENTERYGLGIDTRLADPDGIVRFDPLFPDMKYSVSAKKAGWGEQYSRRIRTTRGQEAEVVIKLPRAGGSVSGVVVDINGKPLPFTEVSYSSNRSGDRDGRSDRDGRFRFDGLVEGDRIMVYTRGKDTAEHHVETTPGDQNIRLVHEPEPTPGD